MAQLSRLLFLAEGQVPFPALKQWLTVVYNSSFRGSGALLGPPQAP